MISNLLPKSTHLIFPFNISGKDFHERYQPLKQKLCLIKEIARLRLHLNKFSLTISFFQAIQILIGVIFSILISGKSF